MIELVGQDKRPQPSVLKPGDEVIDLFDGKEHKIHSRVPVRWQGRNQWLYKLTPGRFGVSAFERKELVLIEGPTRMYPHEPMRI